MTMPTKGYSDVVLSKGKGSNLYDVEGQSYLDFCAGFGSLAFGHRNLDDIISQYPQCKETLVHGLGDLYASHSKIKLLKFLSELFPFQRMKGSLSLSGAQAVEFALKTAFLSNKKSKVLALKNAYHGLELGVLPSTHWAKFKDPFEKILPGFDVIHLSEQEILNLPNSEWSEFGACILEPVQGRGGICAMEQSFLDKVQTQCNDNQVVLIFDEIFCGLGRTGKWHHATQSMKPDIVCFGKTLGGGFPLSATMISEELSENWPDLNGEAIHTGTFFGHPLSCEIGLSTLNELKEKNMFKEVHRKGLRFKEKLSSQLNQHCCEIKIRQFGLMIGLEFSKSGFAVELMHILRSNGMIAIPSGPSAATLSLTPALNISEADLDSGIEILKKSINTNN